MISGSRRLNYTSRHRILREHAQIVTHDGAAGAPPTFDATLTLGGYNLPSPARVYVEAYRQTAWQRFDYGTIGVFAPPENRLLTEFGEGDGVLFRVKVVEPPPEGGGGSAKAAKILAQADQIKPDQAGKRRSLLDVIPGDFRDEVWRLEWDHDGRPLLAVSRHLAPNRFDLMKDAAFRSLALPEILRQVLAAALEEELDLEGDDRETWEGKWVRMVRGATGAPDPTDVRDDDNEREAWVDDAVARFCRKQGVGRTFGKYWQSGGAA